MAVYEDTYDNAIAQTSALCGTDFTDEEKAMVNRNLNLASKRARRKTDYWERLLIVDEPRTVSRGLLQTSEDSFNVHGAGTSDVNGLYVRNGTVNSKAAYTLYDTDGTTAKYDIEWDNSTDWQILSAADVVLYDVTDASTTPPLTGWAVDTGDTPSPLLVDVEDIETALYYRKDNSLFRSSRTYEFAADGYGIRPYALGEENITIFVTYIKKTTDVYGDGTSGTTSSIPAEWFDYMTLYAAYMYQSSQRQNNPNAAYGMALREVDASLDDEMMRLETQGIPQTVRQNVETRLAYSSI